MSALRGIASAHRRLDDGSILRSGDRSFLAHASEKVVASTTGAVGSILNYVVS